MAKQPTKRRGPKPPPPGYESQKGFARLLGVSPGLVNKYVKSGLIKLHAVGKRKFIDVDEAKRALALRINTNPGGNRAGGPIVTAADLPSGAGVFDDFDPDSLDSPEVMVQAYDKARTLEKIFKARLAELDLEKRKGLLVSRLDVESDASRMGALLLQDLHTMAKRVAPMLKGLDTPKIAHVLTDQIDQVLRRLDESDYGGGHE